MMKTTMRPHQLLRRMILLQLLTAIHQWRTRMTSRGCFTFFIQVLIHSLPSGQDATFHFPSTTLDHSVGSVSQKVSNLICDAYRDLDNLISIPCKLKIRLGS